MKRFIVFIVALFGLLSVNLFTTTQAYAYPHVYMEILIIKYGFQLIIKNLDILFQVIG